MANLSIKREAWGHPLASQSGLGDVSFSGYEQAAEAGRRMAAEVVRTDPQARARVEAAFGRAYCEKRYPEAYGQGKNFWGRFFGRS